MKQNISINDLMRSKYQSDIKKSNKKNFTTNYKPFRM